jgi:superfamily I DNA/RNA helicase
MDDTWWVDPTELDPTQREIVTLPAGTSHLVLGPPGSGKSNLLLLRANHLSLAGTPNIAVIVFTRTLERFLDKGGDQYSFDPACIFTSMRWQLQFLERFGVAVDTTGVFENIRARIVTAMRELLDKKKIPPQHQVILLDEAQDYLPEEIEIFRRLSDEIFAVADSRQKIYPGPSGIDALTAIAGRPKNLPFHYRNGRKICLVADELGKRMAGYEPILPSAQYKEKTYPSTVEAIATGDINEQIARLIDVVGKQLRAYPKGMIGVLVPRAEDLKSVWAGLEASTLASQAALHTASSGATFADDRRVCVTTVHSAKGLEFRATNIACAEGFKKFKEQRAMAYVAVTRAKTSLVVLHSGKMPGYLAEALGPVIGSNSSSSLADAFGGKVRKGT